MTTYHPDGSKTIALVSELAAMASSVDDGIEEVVSVRQAYSYVWGNSADRSTETGMTPGSTGVQLDTGGIYTYLNGAWLLTGGTLPTFNVVGVASQSLANGAFETLSTVFGAPAVNTGFSGWTGGVLTIREPGVYMLVASIQFDYNPDGARVFWIASSQITTTADPDFYGRDEKSAEPMVNVGTTLTCSSFQSLAAGDTVRCVAFQNSGVAVPTVAALPQNTRLGVRYLGPAI